MFLVPPIDGLDVLVPLLKRFRFQISAEHRDRGRPKYGRHRGGDPGGIPGLPTAFFVLHHSHAIAGCIWRPLRAMYVSG